MSGVIPARLSAQAALQEGMVTRRQAIQAGMATSAIVWKLHSGRWRQVHWGVYATFTGPPSPKARMWAAVLYAGAGATLSHESAGQLQNLVDAPALAIHVTVPRRREVAPAKGVVIHRSDKPLRLAFPPGVLPTTVPEDTVIDLAEAADEVDGVYGWVTRAFGREVTGEVKMRFALERRKRLRWRSELAEAITAGAGGAHSVLELRWDRDVERAHGLPPSQHQVLFRKKDGRRGYRDRVFTEWGVIIELDGRQAHPDEAHGADNARDNAAAADGDGHTLRYGWKDVRYAACETSAETARVLWRHGWHGKPRPCSPGCPIAALLHDLDKWLVTLAQEQRQASGWQA